MLACTINRITRMSKYPLLLSANLFRTDIREHFLAKELFLHGNGFAV